MLSYTVYCWGNLYKALQNDSNGRLFPWSKNKILEPGLVFSGVEYE